MLTVLSSLFVFVIGRIQADWLDYAGFCVSTGYQASPYSNAQVASIAGQFDIKLYRFYNGDVIPALCEEILTTKPDAEFYIQISSWMINSLTTGDIEYFLSLYDSVKSNVVYIQLGNEPILAGTTFSAIPDALELFCETLLNTDGWSHVKVSIPFSAVVMGVSYPVTDGSFQEPENGGAAQYSDGLCENCVESSTDTNSGASVMYEILTLLDKYGGKFMIQWYPFFTCLLGEASWLDYCLGNTNSGQYSMMLEAQVDATYYAMAKLVGSMDKAKEIGIILTETGWPTASDGVSDITTNNYAQQYYNNLIDVMDDSNSILYGVEIFFFEWFDESKKYGGAWEKYFGWIESSGYGKFTLSQAGLDKSINYLESGTGGDSDDDTTTDDGCQYVYSCLELYDLSSEIYDFNGVYTYSDCYSGKGMYKMTSSDGSYTAYIYQSASLGYYHLYTSVSDDYAYAFCFEDNVYDCSGKWYYWNGKTYQFDEDKDSVIVECSSNNVNARYSYVSDISDDCTLMDDYNDKICLYNENLGGIIEFTKSDLCWDNMPYYYGSVDLNTSQSVYLSYDDSISQWTLKKQNLQNDYYAYCTDMTSDLSQCTYEMWYVVNEQDIDNTMGVFDCNTDTDSDDSANGNGFCGTSSSACAKWEFTLSVASDNNDNDNDLCDDSFKGCVLMELFGEHSEAVGELLCHNTDSIDIMINVTFSSMAGNDIYKKYVNASELLVVTCSDFIGDEDSIDVSITTNDLIACDVCSDFGEGGTSTGDESGTTKNSGVVIGIVLAILTNLF